MANFDFNKLRNDIDEAAAFRHPQRAMRVLLECGHLRLLQAVHAGMGIGAFTSCAVCPKTEDGFYTARMVVAVEETGVLWEKGMEIRDRRN